MIRFLSVCMMVTLLAGCSPLGLAVGAGAAVGVSAAREGGISGTASDIRIKALISDKWFRYDVETFSKLSMTVNQGRVLVTGIVQSPDARVEAVRLAWQVEGVTQVINEIRVAESDGLPGYVRDQWITTRLRTALTFDREVQSINYSIDTVAGTVYLMGVAQNQAELNRVIEVARTIPNVMNVVSYVKMAGETVTQTTATGQEWGAPQSNMTGSGAMIGGSGYNTGHTGYAGHNNGGAYGQPQSLTNPQDMPAESYDWGE